MASGERGEAFEGSDVDERGRGPRDERRRAAAQAAFSRDWEVVAVEEGYYGLLEGEIRPVDRGELWGYVQQGGTALGTGRSSELEEGEEGKQRALELLREAGAEALVVIGGAAASREGLRCTSSACRPLGSPPP